MSIFGWRVQRRPPVRAGYQLVTNPEPITFTSGWSYRLSYRNVGPLQFVRFRRFRTHS